MIFPLLELINSCLSNELEVFFPLSTVVPDLFISNVLRTIMNGDPIVFASANPTPEIKSEGAALSVKTMATGPSDYPNQINTVICFPGMFCGARERRAVDINEKMKLAASPAIESVISLEEPHPKYIIPPVFNRQRAALVARAVDEAAPRNGAARRERSEEKQITS